MDGEGFTREESGAVYQGQFSNGEREGLGTVTHAEGSYEAQVGGVGTVSLGRYHGGAETGEGVRWSADRKAVWRLRDGAVDEEISLAEGKELTARIGLPLPA